jgi:hypothetical protein
MRLLRQVRWFLLVLLTLGGASGVHGDTVWTRSGAEYDGVVRIEVLDLTSTDGKVRVPRSAIREICFSDDGLQVVLLDDTVVVGRPDNPSLEVEVGLIVRSIPFDEVERIRFAPAAPEAGIEEALKTGDFLPAALATPEMGNIQTSCPMKLLLTLPAQLLTTAWRSNELRPFVCDGVVSVPQVISEVRPPKKGLARLQLDFFVLVLPPQDKLSRLSMEVLLDDEIVARGGKAKLSTEEGRTTPVRIVLDLTPADYERWHAGVEEAILKLTVSAVDD